MAGACPSGPLPAFSIAIPALNEGGNLIDTEVVRSHSDALDPEAIVLDDGATDAAPQRAAARFASDPKVRAIRGPQEGAARARIAGAAVSGGDAIVFLDGHSDVPDGRHSPLVAPLAGAAVPLAEPVSTSIRHQRLVDCGITWEDEGLGSVRLPAATSGPVPVHIGACQVVRAGAFTTLGGFDQGMDRWGSEGIGRCARMWRMGWQVHAAPHSDWILDRFHNGF